MKPKEVILSALEEGFYNVTELASLTGLQRSSVYRWLERLIAEGLVRKSGFRYALKNRLTLKVQRALEEYAPV